MSPNYVTYTTMTENAIAIGGDLMIVEIASVVYSLQCQVFSNTKDTHSYLVKNNVGCYQ